MSVTETDPQVAETTHAGIGSRRLKPLWWLAIAALFFLALWAWSELRIRAARAEIEELRAANRALQQDALHLRNQNDRSVATLRMLSAGATRTFIMAGQKAAPGASARLYFDPAQRRAMVFVYDLPANPPDKTYQIWITGTGGSAPTSAGLFDATDRGEAELSLENLPAAEEMRSVLITLEPRGGSPAPTGPRYLAGRAS